MILLSVLILMVLSAFVQCQSKIPSRCLLPEESGPCLAYIPSYRFDDATKKCVNFVYGGCRGNENRFGTIQECINVCGAKNSLNPPANCKRPQEVGRCVQATQTFYFDRDDSACKIYGGCGPEENNFDTLEQCENTCKVYEN